MCDALNYAIGVLRFFKLLFKITHDSVLAIPQWNKWNYVDDHMKIHLCTWRPKVFRSIFIYDNWNGRRAIKNPHHKNRQNFKKTNHEKIHLCETSSKRMTNSMHRSTYTIRRNDQFERCPRRDAAKTLAHVTQRVSPYSSLISVPSVGLVRVCARWKIHTINVQTQKCLEISFRLQHSTVFWAAS